MGVHISFVRSCDLDEWTQRQIDAMRLGGNDNAKKFFAKYPDGAGKTDKKYTSKAAVAYRAELAKLVEAEAVKRGEGEGEQNNLNSIGGSSSLLDNADAMLRKEMEDEARSKINSSNGTVAGSGGVLQPSAKLASQMSGARGRLATPAGTPIPTPPASGGLNVVANGTTTAAAATAGGGPKLVLRKPSTTQSTSRLLKKGSSLSVSSKLRVNKISGGGGDADDDAFEDVETTQKNIEEDKQQEVEEKKRLEEEDAKLARELQEKFDNLETNNGSGGGLGSTTTVVATSEVAAAAVAAQPPASAAAPQISAMEKNMKKLSSMNSDFFSGL